MNNAIKKILSATITFAVVIVMAGILSVSAEADSNAVIYICPASEINVYSPITNTFDYEPYVNIQSLFMLKAQNATRIHGFDINPVQCEDTLAAHQEVIDNIFAVIWEHGIEDLSDLSVILQSLQNDSNYVPIIPFACSFGNCALVPVWVTINGVRLPAFLCTICGRLIFV